jgi:mannose-1-phosphate guanylyltransferase / mannose-6-phosphate isomerase
MTEIAIHPVLLAGGSGTRLWPASRQSFPKQFAPLLGEESLFQATVQRLSAPGFAAPIVVTAEDFRFIAGDQLSAMACAPQAILLEPEARNTAPAALAAALWLVRRDPEAVMLIAPSDHAIPDAELFAATVRSAIPAAQAGRIVTFGIAPTRPETGYGYLEPAGDARGASPQPVRRFVEKPDADTAAALATDGRHLWNAGIFLARAGDLVAAYRAHAPDILAPVAAALAQAMPDLGFLRLAAEPWSDAPSISIDFAVMERAANLSVMAYPGRWSDLGSWDAVHAETHAPDGNALAGRATAIDCRDTLLRSDSDTVEVVGIGLDGIVAVAMPDAVLVARREDSQRVKDAVEALRRRGVRQADDFPRTHRPWGWFDTLAEGDRFQVKRIVVKPGAALSLQSHLHRAEHWIVVQGTARVTIEENTRLVPENESVFIPLGARHRLENPGRIPMVLIEVQTGRYLGEDDILRHADDYARI